VQVPFDPNDVEAGDSAIVSTNTTTVSTDTATVSTDSDRPPTCDTSNAVDAPLTSPFRAMA
jgi:hypothetical protein